MRSSAIVLLACSAIAVSAQDGLAIRLCSSPPEYVVTICGNPPPPSGISSPTIFLPSAPAPSPASPAAPSPPPPAPAAPSPPPPPPAAPSPPMITNSPQASGPSYTIVTTTGEYICSRGNGIGACSGTRTLTITSTSSSSSSTDSTAAQTTSMRPSAASGGAPSGRAIRAGEKWLAATLGAGLLTGLIAFGL